MIWLIEKITGKQVAEIQTILGIPVYIRFHKK